MITKTKKQNNIRSSFVIIKNNQCQVLYDLMIITCHHDLIKEWGHQVLRDLLIITCHHDLLRAWGHQVQCHDTVSTTHEPIPRVTLTRCVIIRLATSISKGMRCRVGLC